MRLSDRAARTFTASLMWSNESGTDGKLPPECYGFLHPLGLDNPTAEELVSAGWWKSGPDGYYIPDWTGASGQESAATVATRKANNRKYQAEHRARKAAEEAAKGESLGVSDDVSPDVSTLPAGQAQDRTQLAEGELAGTVDLSCPDCQRSLVFNNTPCKQHRKDAA
jgi:hypothetical protein